MLSSSPVFVTMWYLSAIYLPFAFAFGAIVGSFLNVVIYRVPAGLNIISPPSRCPVCEKRLKWYQNLPIIGWIWLRARCRNCGTPISIQYPIVELTCGLVFTAFFILCYLVRPTAPYLGGLVPSYFVQYGFDQTWPMFLIYLILFSSLLAMTIIDRRTYMIPIELTWAIAIPAILFHTMLPIWPGGGMRPPLSLSPATFLNPNVITLAHWTIPLVGPVGLGAAMGGMLGVFFSIWLLRRGFLRHSFADFDLVVKDDDRIIDYPYARQEIEWEIDFLTPVFLGLLVGAMAGGTFLPVNLPLWAQALGGSLTGYLVGGGIVWIIRILGTLGFGKEAMGLGDAHLLAGVGAALGWIDATLIFFLAPFLVLIAMLIAAPLSMVIPRLKGYERYLAYGPALAAATFVVLLGDRWLEPFFSQLFGHPIDFP